ncbi:NAD-P-binding protein [Rickenella mellea]|uniref:NAD-P-binding protein n=1 Tax=Rickenella mellea TaxID=50990 RepID=A0A4Y7PLZ5_9AGAM|nr:NAD-P-binding protein [Rickenella mellea]
MPDILVLGATGYTGRLITRYLRTHPSRSMFSFSIGGRSKPKLLAVLSELHPDSGGDVEVVEVDVTDDASVERAVRAFKVVINAVGPFWTYGTGVVRACAKNGTHHVDITAETAWVKLIIEQFDALARTTGSLIVPSCGLDSVPSDMAVHLSSQTLKAHFGLDTTLGASSTCSMINGGMSGGTLASLLTAMENVPRESVHGALWNPYELSPLKGLTKLSSPLRLHYRLPSIPGSPVQHGAFFPLAPHNAAIVHRTWGILQRQTSPSSLPSSSSYGPEFSYDEFCAASGWLSGSLFSLAMKVTLICLLYFPPARWWLRRVGPAVGSGPSEEALEQGSMEIVNVTSTAPSSSEPQAHVKTVIRGRGDPGYLLTSIMVSECALCLLDTSNPNLPEMARRGGVLTPMTAFGDVLVERLRKNERFEIESAVVRMSGQGVDGKKTR